MRSSLLIIQKSLMHFYLLSFWRVLRFWICPIILILAYNLMKQSFNTLCILLFLSISTKRLLELNKVWFYLHLNFQILRKRTFWYDLILEHMWYCPVNWALSLACSFYEVVGKPSYLTVNFIFILDRLPVCCILDN